MKQSTTVRKNVVEAAVRSVANRKLADALSLEELVDTYLSDHREKVDADFESQGFVGYTNSTPGDETTEVVKVKKFTKKQLETRETVKELKQLIALGRAATKLLQQVQEQCPHRVFYDQQGWPYDSRECRVCECGMGLL